MGLIRDLLKEFPAAAKYGPALQAMEDEVERLKAENAQLSDELACFTHRWQTLDGDAVETLVYLSRYEHGNAIEIAQANEVNIQIVEAYLNHLLKSDYVHADLNGPSHYRLTEKGRRYLHERRIVRS